MPRLNLTFAEFVAIISPHGFALHRRDGGSHQRWRGVVKGEVRFVDLAPHTMKDDVPTGTLAQMIRQSGLPKHLFRK